MWKKYKLIYVTLYSQVDMHRRFRKHFVFIISKHGRIPTYLAQSLHRISEVSNFRCMHTGKTVLCNITDPTDLNF